MAVIGGFSSAHYAESRGLFGSGVPDSRSGLKIGDFGRWGPGSVDQGLRLRAAHEGRRAGQGTVNVGFLAFHEGRGAGKTGAQGVMI